MVRPGPSLDGKVALVTGAGRGLGRAHALALAEAGAAVIVNDLGTSMAGTGSDPGPAHEVVEQIVAAGGRAAANGDDVTDFESAARLVDHAIEEFGGLDILVNNAGILRDRMLVNMDEAEWDQVISVHLKGHFCPLRHAAAYWREQAKSGSEVRARVINTTSPSGVFGNTGQANYGAAKAGIAALTVIAALELQRYGVTVNCLAPNARTRMTEGIFAATSSDGQGFDPWDPANGSPVVVALCADEAQGITGQCFFVYGGVVNVLRPWGPGELLTRDGRWPAGELLDELTARFPDGIAPEGLQALFAAASGHELLDPSSARGPAPGTYGKTIALPSGARGSEAAESL